MKARQPAPHLTVPLGVPTEQRWTYTCTGVIPDGFDVEMLKAFVINAVSWTEAMAPFRRSSSIQVESPSGLVAPGNQ